MNKTFRKGLFGLLSTHPLLTPLQGDRVYPVILQTSIFPATTFKLAGGSQDATFDTSGMQRRRVQLDHFGVTDDDADDLREATFTALNGFQGYCPNGFYIELCEFIQPIDHEDNDSRMYRLSAEYYFQFTLS